MRLKILSPFLSAGLTLESVLQSAAPCTEGDDFTLAAWAPDNRQRSVVTASCIQKLDRAIADRKELASVLWLTAVLNCDVDAATEILKGAFPMLEVVSEA